MPNAALLTPRVDVEQDQRIQALWDDRSSAVRAINARPAPVSDVFVPIAVLTAMSSARPPMPFMSSSVEAPQEAIAVLLPRFELRSSAAGRAPFAERFEALRSRVRLPVQKYARLLGASRRTLYHWLETDRPQELAVDRVDRLVDWVAELERHFTTAEIQRLLDPEAADSIGALLVDQGLDAVAERVRVTIEEAQRPRQAVRLDVLADDPGGEPPGATADELRGAFAAFAAPRPHLAPSSPRSEPPELTY